MSRHLIQKAALGEHSGWKRARVSMNVCDVCNVFECAMGKEAKETVLVAKILIPLGIIL